MTNPFEKRATEYLREDEAFLAVVTPEPLTAFFERPASEGRLYDRLTMIIGTPGSGKTTLARLFQYSTLRALLRNPNFNTYKPLIDTLSACGAINAGRPVIIGGRLPLEAEYREFWDLPYPDDIKTGLMISLLQARTVLTWLRNVQMAGISIEQVEIIPRRDAEASLELIGGVSGPELLSRARQVELGIYRIVAALMPPKIEEIDSEASEAYRPFDVIEAFKIPYAAESLHLRPLVILDDAHSLHPAQFASLRRWLVRRELKVGRWVLTRLDALTPSEVLMEPSTPGSSTEPGIKRDREITTIWLQGGQSRASQRKAFRKMAKDMGSRYLTQMDVFNRRRLHSLGDLLSTEKEALSAAKRKQLAQRVEALRRRYSISSDRFHNIEKEVSNYLRGANSEDEDLRLALVSIQLERYVKRIPNQQSLFPEIVDVEPSRPLTVNAGMADGAMVHLLHKYDRPYYFGIDDLCDASSENAEQFLQLASRLVSQAETQVIRLKRATLSSGLQNKLLRQRAAEIVGDWDFPHHQLVRRLAEGIALECLAKSLEGNVSLGGGAIGFGILQEEFEAIPRDQPDLARVLKFGVAYNAFSLVPNHGTKNKLWYLIELGGVLLLHYGLTLKRGGFLERSTTDLVRLLGET